ALDRECEPARRDEGLGALVEEAGADQRLGDELAQVLGRARLHARRNFLGEQFEQKVGHREQVAGAPGVVKSKSVARAGAGPRATPRGARACGPPRPAARLRGRRSGLGLRQAIKSFACSFGARAAVLCAVASWAVAAAASADEPPYLIYLRGSEAPPAVP